MYELLPIVITIAVIGIAIGYTIDIQDDIKQDLACPSGYSFNESATTLKACYLTTNSSIQLAQSNQADSLDETIDASGGVADKVPMVIVVTLAAFVIGCLAFLYGERVF